MDQNTHVWKYILIQLQIYKLDETLHTEDIDSRVMNFLSEYLKPDESPIDSPDIVYEESKGCQAFVSFIIA